MKTKGSILKIIALSLVLCCVVACCVIKLNQMKYIADLNDYVTITETGGEGYGKIIVDINYDKFISDYSHCLIDENLDEKYETPEMAAKAILTEQNPYLLGYELNNNLKNGDVIEFTWKIDEEAIAELSKVLDVDIRYNDFEYKMKKLRSVTEVDIFEDVRFQKWGTNGNGSISPFPEAFLAIEETGDVLTFPLNITDYYDDGNLSNGDVIHVSLSENVNLDHLLNTYGIVITRTEADIVLEGFPEN